MKSNREKNLEHAARADARVRPAKKDYDFTALEAVLRQWRPGPAVTCAQGPRQ